MDNNIQINIEDMTELGRGACSVVYKYDDTTVSLDAQLGIKAAVTTEYGFSSINDGLYTLKRVRISPMSMDSFISIFSPFTE